MSRNAHQSASSIVARVVRNSALALLCLLTAFAAGAKEKYVTGQILVRPKPGFQEQRFHGLLASHAARERGRVHRMNVRVISVPESKVDQVLDALRRNPQIEFAERDGVAQAASLPNDPYVVSGTEWHLAKIQAPQAWDITSGANVIVAVLDSGVNAAHPDLAGRILPGFDFVNDTSNPADDFGHGTAVAGTIAANGNNGTGVAGVAFKCLVLPVKVMDSGGVATYSAIAKGISYAVDQGARVINISIAGSASSLTLQQAIDYAWQRNVIVVAAAGNNGNNTVLYPAGCSNVVAISATTASDTLATFSSYGDHLALSAPGEDIWSTHMNPATGYYAWRGSSFASPIVAATAALAISANPTLANGEIVSLLEQTADDLGPLGFDSYFGHGRVNAARAVGAAIQLAGDSVAPIILTQPASQTALAGGTAVLSVETGGTRPQTCQWKFNGAEIAGATNFTLALSGVQISDAGVYAAEIGNIVGGVVSQPATLVVTTQPAERPAPAPDTVPPMVAITSAPKDRARLTSPLVSLSGTAGDNVGVTRVEVQLNAGPYLPVVGTSAWSAQLTLAPGMNTVRVCSIDLAGNASVVETRVYTCVVRAALKLQTLGAGAVSPNLNGRLLEIGRTYTVRAVPGPGQAFANWEGVESDQPTLTFTMQSNLTLTAKFVPSPFAAAKATYAGLAYNENSVTPQSSAYFSLQLANSGSFVGKVQQGSRTLAMRGQFNAAGKATVSIARPLSTPLTIVLNVNVSSGADALSGSVSDGNWKAGLFGSRNVFNAQSNPAPQAGRRSFALLSADGNAATAGAGSATIAASGTARFKGTLSDGRRFSSSTVLAKNGACPFYLSLSRGSEVMIGWLNFGPAADANGTVLWVKSGTNGFATALHATMRP